MKPYGTLCVLDDSATILTALKFALEGLFDHILLLSSPDRLLAILGEQRVDLVLLDMNFTLGANTGQEGLLWLRAVRKHHPEVPVVLLTAYANVDLAVRGLKQGASDFVVKPWDNDELERKVRDVLDRRPEVQTLEDMEAEHIRRAIDREHGNLSKAAELLGITRQTLYNKMKKMNF